MKKSELIEEIINELAYEDLLNVDNYEEYCDFMKAARCAINKALSNYVIIKGEILE